jgi:PAS domain S-box-containing protein
MASSIELAARLSAVVATQQDVLAAITDPDKVMSLVVQRTPDVTNGTGAVIEFVSGDELVYRAASGAAQNHAGLRLSLHSSLSGVAVREKTLVRCDNTESDPRVDGAACRALGIRSMIIAPLLENQTAVGALKTFSSIADAFSDLDAYALQLMAGMTSAALTQARTFRDLEVSEARYRMLFEQNVAGVFRSTMDGRILDCNEALAQFLGYDSREDLLTRSAWSLYHNRADREELLRLVKSQSMLNIRMPFARKDGTSLLAVLNASLLPGAGDDRELLGTIVEA